MECTLAFRMIIEVLKRKPNSTRILDYLTFLTLTLNSIEDLKIKFFPFTTKPRDAAQKRSEAGESGNVKLEPHLLSWEQAEITKKQQFIQRVSFHRASSTVSLDIPTEVQRVSAHRLANALPGPSWELTQPPKQFPWSHCIAVGYVWKL